MWPAVPALFSKCKCMEKKLWAIFFFAPFEGGEILQLNPTLLYDKSILAVIEV